MYVSLGRELNNLIIKLMKRNKAILYTICAAMLAMGACTVDDEINPDDETTQTEDPVIPDDTGDTADDDLQTNSQTVNYDNAVTITFSSSGASVDNPFSDSGVTVTNDNGHIVITSTITELELNYILSGIIVDGSVKIYGEKKYGLILNGTGITNSKGAAINIQNKKKCMLTLVDNTNNRLIDAASYTQTDGEDQKATFFSEGNTEISGNGTLEIRGKYKHALCIDGSLLMASGTINIKEAASDGIHANDEVRLEGGSLTIRSTGDAIDCESTEEAVSITGGTLSITTTGQKGHAVKAGQDINVNTDGTIDITLYGAASKGLKPTGNLTITKGDININTAGDAIWEDDEQDTSSAAGVKCDGNFLMDNGTLTILSTGSGGKGINVDGTLTINDGTVTVTTTGDQYVYDRNNDTAAKAIKSEGDLTINGGTVKVRTSKTEAEGIESKATLKITGGNIDVIAYDDGFNATNHIQIDGGTIYVESETNDAIDSNGTMTFTGGTLVAAGSTNPEGAFDCDNSRFSITGGTIVGIGGSNSTPTTAYCTQRTVIYGTSAKPEIIHIEPTSGGNAALTFKLPRTYTSMSLFFSSPTLAASTGYTIYTGGSITGGSNINGIYTGATYTKGSQATTFTTGSAAGSVTTIGTSGGQQGGGRW